MSSQPRTLEAADLDLLAEALSRLTNGHRRPVEVATATVLREGVHRVELNHSDRAIVKRLRSKRAQLERRLTDRWLPGAGLDGFGPPRLSTVAEPDGAFVWHVYDDLGTHGLDRAHVDAEVIAQAMGRLADLHARFAGHLLLPEVRFAAGDLGVTSTRAACATRRSRWTGCGRLGCTPRRRRPRSGTASWPDCRCCWTTSPPGSACWRSRPARRRSSTGT